jgi:DNA modification methylase
VSGSVIAGDCRDVLPTLEPESVQCVVTSPPYWGLRDYGVDGQLGLERTPDEYVANLVSVFAAVRRALRRDGVCWLNIGDSYVTSIGQGLRGGPPSASSTLEGRGHCGGGPKLRALRKIRSVDPKGGVERAGDRPSRTRNLAGLKHKDMALIPARLSLALQADGWWVRSKVVWRKPNPMPESVTDRPTKSYEEVFLLAKSERYFYDAAAIAEPATGLAPCNTTSNKHEGEYHRTLDERLRTRANLSKIEARETRNARDVWTVAPMPYDGAHFAVMPPELAARCILAGSRIGDTVLDPFMGSGTVGMVAEGLGRRWLGIELNPAYGDLIAKRTAQRGLFTWVSAQHDPAAKKGT